MGDPGQSCMSGTLNLVLCLMKTLNLDPLTQVLWGTECEDACGWLQHLVNTMCSTSDYSIF